ncbi:hypothetical protein Aple_028700 [Acrocarpospora pleiomorpha]|uniref:Nucleotide pyrophosphatase n=1 Tax=Acrocarpospora pleiomorpha TaxID=90975 RepID=A0A5M3XFC4_9ACTN|nr:alkaline phosphatase family protein [Acrocarpospora pleiomorpha]GES19974.1 hypothetical protein Aple_028700 [Acrocarpospora pleiomorpha]
MKPVRLIFVVDGLHKRSINSTDTPCLHRLRTAGTECTTAVTVVPALTRPAAAALATACLPGATGIIGNHVYVPGHGVASTGSVTDLNVLATIYGAVVDVPTIGAFLAERGHRMAVIGTGSAGCTHLLYPDASTSGGTVVRASAAADEPLTTPPALQARIVDAIGPRPAATASFDLLTWASDVAATLLVPDPATDLLVFWSGEPDTAQHHHGIDQPHTRQAIRAADQALQRLLDAASRHGRPIDVIVTSDHGVRTTGATARPDLDAYRDLGPAAASLAFVPNDGALLVYRTADQVPVDDLARWALDQAWAGTVYADVDRTSPVIPLATAGCKHPSRSPDLLVTMGSIATDHGPATWNTATVSAEQDPTTYALKATHGTSHRDDLEIPLILHGPSFRSATRSEIPAGLVDVAATMAYLVTAETAPHWDGRVLHETLRPAPGRADPPAPTVTADTVAHTDMGVAHVGDSTYLLGAVPIT